jgi:hypothetical protein
MLSAPTGCQQVGERDGSQGRIVESEGIHCHWVEFLRPIAYGRVNIVDTGGRPMSTLIRQAWLALPVALVMIAGCGGKPADKAADAASSAMESASEAAESAADAAGSAADAAGMAAEDAADAAAAGAADAAGAAADAADAAAGAAADAADAATDAAGKAVEDTGKAMQD